MRKKYGIILFAFICIAASATAQSVVVTDDNTYITGQASSVLDVKSTSKGFLAPRSIDQDTTHCFRRCPTEMYRIVPLKFWIELQEHFIHKRGRCESIAR